LGGLDFFRKRIKTRIGALLKTLTTNTTIAARVRNAVSPSWAVRSGETTTNGIATDTFEIKRSAFCSVAAVAY
jgi:hypothetical protein